MDGLSHLPRSASFPRSADRREASLAEHYRRVRAATEKLAEPLSPEDCQIQSMPDASPTKWHLAHTTWFFETFLLERREADFRPFHPEFRVLFNSYYETVGAQHPRPQRGLLSRPSLDEVLAYRKNVDERMGAVFEAHRGAAETEALVTVGLHHEQQHQELLLTDIKHALSCNPLRPAYANRTKPDEPHDTPALRWHRVGGGIVSIGHRGEGFAFDNELPAHDALLRPFEIASRPVTNREYRAFIADDGYRRPELWLSDGWATVCSRGWACPEYWSIEGDGARSFTLAGELPIDDDEPVVHVSYYEADAYARWAGARLPDEVEWETVARTADRSGNFVESRRLHPVPAGGDGVQQMFGDVWEWTRSPYSPYPGYRPLAGALGEYNGKFMCNQMVLRGGSCATPASHIRATYRNFFPPDARWQFSGIRLARDA